MATTNTPFDIVQIADIGMGKKVANLNKITYANIIAIAISVVLWVCCFVWLKNCSHSGPKTGFAHAPGPMPQGGEGPMLSRASIYVEGEWACVSVSLSAYLTGLSLGAVQQML